MIRSKTTILLLLVLITIFCIKQTTSKTSCGALSYSTPLQTCTQSSGSNAYEDYLTAIALGPNSELAITSGVNPPNYIAWSNGVSSWSCAQQQKLPDGVYNVDSLLFWQNSSLWYILSDHSVFYASSPDSTWTQIAETKIKLGFWRSLASNEDTIVIVGDSPVGGVGMCFFNDQSWNDISLPVDYSIFNLESVAFGGPSGSHAFLLGADHLQSGGNDARVPLLTSTDGCNWKVSNATFTGANQCDAISQIAYGNNVWVIFCFSHQISQASIWVSSDNASSFSLLSLTGDWIYGTNKLKFIDGLFVAVGNNSFYVSANGSTWDNCSLSISSNLFDVSSGGDGSLVAVGSNYEIVHMANSTSSF